MEPCIEPISEAKTQQTMNLADTLKAAISKRLRGLNIDPDSYISEEYTEEEDVKKRRVRGLKVVNNRQ